MTEARQLVLFSLDEQRFALHLEAVQRVVRAVEITPLPRLPEIALGVVNVRGTILPVMNVRQRFGLPGREIELSDQLIIARARKRPVALLVDEVSGVIERSDSEIVAGERILPGSTYVEGVTKLPDGLVFIHDLDEFLSLEEERLMDEGLAEGQEVEGSGG